MNHLIIVCLLFIFSLGASADGGSRRVSKNEIAKIKSLAADFYFEKSLKTFKGFSINSLSISNSSKLKLLNDECEEEPQIGSCINAICSKLPSYKCDDDYELKEVAKMCVNNKDGTCINTICSKLPSYKCDDDYELKEIAKMCSGPVDGKCISNVCSKLPEYKCDDESEIKAWVQECKGLLDGSCVDAICSKLPSYQCDDEQELKNIIATCKSP